MRTGRAPAHHYILDDIADVVGFHAVRVVARIHVAIFDEDVLALDVEAVSADAGMAVDLYAAGDQVFALEDVYAPRRRVAQGKVLQAHLAALVQAKTHRLRLVVARIVVGPAVSEDLALAGHRNICDADSRNDCARHRPARLRRHRVVRRIPRRDETSPLLKSQFDVRLEKQHPRRMVARGNYDRATASRACRVNRRLPLRRLQSAAVRKCGNGKTRRNCGNNHSDVHLT